MVNKVILIGNLGADPEIRFTANGSAVANLRLATTETWTKDGQKQERTEWHRVVAFSRLAEICRDYLNKGSRIYIEGKLQTRSWEDQSGNKRYTTEIVAREMKMLSPRGSGGQQQVSYDDVEPVAEPLGAPMGAPMDDDVPF